jgi:hypothetical protein
MTDRYQAVSGFNLAEEVTPCCLTGIEASRSRSVLLIALAGQTRRRVAYANSVYQKKRLLGTKLAETQLGQFGRVRL